MLKRTLCILVLLLGAYSAAAGQANAASSQSFLSPIDAGWSFWSGGAPKDLSGHWSERLFQWAIRSKIIAGYPDGTYKPDRPVVEAEFLLMLYRAYGANPYPSALSGGKWSDDPYGLAQMWNQPAPGLVDESTRTAPMKRVTAAELIVAAKGLHYNGDDAIRYLLGSRLASGKTAATVEGFDGEAAVTRAEALQWIRNLKLGGTARIQMRPQTESDPSLIPPLPPAGAGLKDFMMIPAEPSDLALLDEAGRVFPMGAPKSAVDGALGEPDDQDVFGMDMYGSLSVHYDPENRMDAWSVSVDTPDESAPYRTSRGIAANRSTLSDVLRAYGTAGYVNDGIANYIYERVDGILVPRVGRRDIGDIDNAYVISFSASETGEVGFIYAATYKHAYALS